MNEFSREKVLEETLSPNDQPYPSRWTAGPGDEDEGHWVVLHDQGEGFQQPIHFRRRNREVPQGDNEMSKIQIPI